MPFSNFKLLTFDVVGTLIDFEKGILDSVRRLGGEKAVGLSDDEIFAPYLRSRETITGRSSQVFADIYLYVARELGLLSSPALAEQFQLDVINWPAYPDSAEALARLRKKFKLVAMTNADRTAFSAYANTLGSPFHEGITCDDAETAKPDPKFFSYNLGRQSAFGYKKSEILHVAQSQYHDIGVARDLGYTVCWIERRHNMEGYGGTPVPKNVTKPDFHFHSLAELADAVFAEGNS